MTMRLQLIGTVCGAGLALGSAQANAQPRPQALQQGTAISQPAARPQQRGPQPQQQALPVPSAQTLLILIKSSLIALNQANQTGVYHVLYGIGSDRLRATQTPDRMAQSFAAFRASNIDLNPIIYLNPQLVRQPVVVQNRLQLAGSFPTSPMQVNFDMTFEPSQGRWKLSQINVNLARAQGQPGAPSAAQPPRQQIQPPRSQPQVSPPRR